MRRVSPLALVAWLSCLPACGRPCDQAGLEKAAATMQADNPGAQAAGVRELLEACPSMPSSLADALMVRWGDLPPDQRSTVAASYTRDPKWFELRRQACPATDEALAAAHPDDQKVYEVCDLARFGIASADRPFVTDDMTAYVLLQWLFDQRNDRARAKAVIEPLLVSSADLDTLWNGCLSGQTACPLAMRRRGIELPTSSAAAPLRPGLMVELDRETVRLGDEVLMQLEHGRAEPEAFASHVHRQSLTVLSERADQDRSEAEATMREWDGRMVLLADRYVGWRTLASMMFTAVKAGYREFEIAVSDGDEVRGLSVSPPRFWLRPPKDGWGPRRGRSLGLTLNVDREALRMTWSGGLARFEAQGDCWDVPSDCHATRQLGRQLRELKATHPHESVVTIRAAGDLPLETVVSLADAARGPECRHHGFEMGEAPAADCLFWQPIVDLQPGLFWLIDRIERLGLGKAYARTFDDAPPGGPKSAAVLEAFDEHKRAIRWCLLDDPQFRRNVTTEDRVSVMWGGSGKGDQPTAVRVWAPSDDSPWASPEAEACIAKLLGAPVANRRRTNEFTKQLQLEMAFATSIPSEPI